MSKSFDRAERHDTNHVESVMNRLQRGQLLFCVAAALSLIASVSFWFTGHQSEALFVGLWVPSILSLGSLLLHGRRSS